MNSDGLCGHVWPGWGLIKGLAYLHKHQVAHLNIKLDNLVCDD
jgi:serine/threonine protein kinase